jgi:hypothetical protein
MNADGFGTRVCGICGRSCRWDDDWCSDPCEREAERRTFLDGNRVTPGTEQCVCGRECEMPCWQRIGLTDRPCCSGCAPLPRADAA